MKNLVFYIVLFCNTAFAQISVTSNKMTTTEKQQIAEYLKTHDKVVITASTADSALFDVINQYRNKNSLNTLQHSVRLDTLAEKVIYQHLDTIEIVHYTHLPEMQQYRDLMSLENLEYGRGANAVSIDKVDEYVDIKDILQGWINSPGHNRNLLSEAHVGTAKIILIVRKSTFKNGLYDLTIRAIYEADYKTSKRELGQNVNDVNQKRFQRKIVIKKS